MPLRRLSYKQGLILPEYCDPKGRPYTCQDKDNRIITINRKRPDNQKNFLFLERKPVYFDNIGSILTNGEAREQIAKQPVDSREAFHATNGEVRKYFVRNFLRTIGLAPENVTDITSLTVRYGFNGYNQSLSYATFVDSGLPTLQRYHGLVERHVAILSDV